MTASQKLAATLKRREADPPLTVFESDHASRPRTGTNPAFILLRP